MNLESKILRVENGLVSSDENESAPQFSLSDRLNFYQTPGVSITVIDKGKREYN